MRFVKFNKATARSGSKDKSKMKTKDEDREISANKVETASIHSTTSRLLDKLQLGEDEWNYDVDVSTNSTESDKTIHTVYSHKNLQSQVTNSKPANQFRSLKSVIDTNSKDAANKPSVISRALEDDDVTVNSVHPNKVVYVSRDQVKSIHLDDLLHRSDSESTITIDESDFLDDDQHSTERLGLEEPEVFEKDNLATPTKQTFDETPVASPTQSFHQTPKQMHHTSILYSPLKHPYSQKVGHAHSNSNASANSVATAPIHTIAKDKKRGVLDNLMRSSSAPTFKKDKRGRSPQAPLPAPPERYTSRQVPPQTQYTQHLQQYAHAERQNNSPSLKPTSQLKSPFLNQQSVIRPPGSPTVVQPYQRYQQGNEGRFNNSTNGHNAFSVSSHHPQQQQQQRQQQHQQHQLHQQQQQQLYQQHRQQSSNPFYPHNYQSNNNFRPPSPRKQQFSPQKQRFPRSPQQQQQQRFQQSPYAHQYYSTPPLSKPKNTMYGDVDLSSVLPR